MKRSCRLYVYYPDLSRLYRPSVLIGRPQRRRARGSGDVLPAALQRHHEDRRRPLQPDIARRRGAHRQFYPGWAGGIRRPIVGGGDSRSEEALLKPGNLLSCWLPDGSGGRGLVVPYCFPSIGVVVYGNSGPCVRPQKYGRPACVRQVKLCPTDGIIRWPRADSDRRKSSAVRKSRDDLRFI